MGNLDALIEANRDWANRVTCNDPSFFQKLAQQQSPKYLWIGCSDSRVPANQIVGLPPGEIFVHRNVANIVVHTDLNCLSVIQYAVDVLKVEHIIVCGHYGCGGIMAALRNQNLGLISNWLRHVQDVRLKHSDLISALSNETEQADKLCELNVINQVINISQTTIVQGAWERGQNLTINSWIYKLTDGLIRNLGLSVASQEQVLNRYPDIIKSIAKF
jgi:carbonic anhydrase